jgi:WD40 repeat protein
MPELAERLRAMSPERRRYTLRDLPAHLAAAGRSDRLREVLTSFAFLDAKLAAFGPQPLVDDYRAATAAGRASGGISLIGEAVTLSAHVLAAHRGELWNQLYGRLLTSDHPDVRALLTDPPGGHWLRPLLAAMPQVGDALRRTLTGHAGAVLAVAVTPDGLQVVSGSNDQTIKVWDAATGQERMTIAGHRSPVRALAVTPDGSRVLAAAGQVLKLWDLETGRALLHLRGHRREIRAVAVTPDGRWAVSASEDLSLRVWDLDTGELLHQLHGHEQRLTAVAVSPDGRLAVSSARGGEGDARVWDLRRGSEIRRLRHGGGAESLAITSDGRSVLVAHAWIELVDLRGGHAVTTFSGGHTDRIHAVVVTPDGRRVVSASSDHTLRIWSLRSGRVVRTLGGHGGEVTAVAVGGDPPLIASGSDDRTVRLWTTGRARRHALAGHTRLVATVAMTADGRRAVSVSQDQTLKVWDLDAGRELRTIQGLNDLFHVAAITPDGHHVLASEGTSTLTVWVLETGRKVHAFLDGRHGYPGRIVVTPDGARVVTFTPGYWSGGKSTLEVRELASGAPPRELVGHEGSITSVAVTTNGRRLVSGSEDGTIRVWDLARARQERALSGHADAVRGVAVTPSGREVLSVAGDGTVRLWRTGSATTALSCKVEDPAAVWLLPVARRFLSQTSDRRLWLHDAARGFEARALVDLEDKVHDVRLREDGARLAVLTQDTLSVWDPARRTPLARYTFEGMPTSWAVSSSVSRFVVGEGSGRVHLLRLEGPTATGARGGAGGSPG